MATVGTTIGAVTSPAPGTDADAPPPRFLLRPAGVLTQLVSAACLLLGTIAFVLVQQNKTGGAAIVVAWAVAAMIGLVFGGLMARGGLVSVLGGAAIDAAFGTVLLVIDYDTLRTLLRLLPDSDVQMIADGLVGAAVGMLAIAVLCLASVPQARRYHKALREAEREAEASGMWQGGSPSQSMQVPVYRGEAGEARAMPVAILTTRPGPGAVGPSGVPTVAPGASPMAPAYGRGGAGSNPAHAAMPPQYAPPQGPPYGHNAPTMMPHARAPYAPHAQAPYAPNPAPYGAPNAAMVMPHAPQSDPSSQGYGRASQPLPLPAPPQTSPIDGPPPAIEDNAATNPVGIAVHMPSSASTARGWTPSPVRTTTMMLIRPPAEERRSRRRVYFALGGLAIGAGVGLGVLVSSSQAPDATATSSASGSGSGSATTPDHPTTPATTTTTSPTNAGSGSNAITTTDPGVEIEVAKPTVSVRSLITAQREALAKADSKAFAALVAPTAFAFGIDAEDVVEGRDAIEATITKNLGESPGTGFRVESKFLAVGEEKNHAWTAEEIAISGDGVEERRIAITQLAAFIDGKWTVVALHWGVPVPDATAERLAILGTLPTPKLVPNRADGAGDLDKAIRGAFASRSAFAESRSERDDGFNFGSGPGERVTSGTSVKRVFNKLRATLTLNGGARVASASAWDPTQKEAPWIGWAAVNVDYTHKTRAATDVTQTFRVLAVLVREADTWRIVQTQFSNGGPIR